MELKKYRWSKTYEAGEAELEGLLLAKNIEAERWEAEGDEEFATHSHPKDKKLWCSEGSITFTMGSGSFALQAGDALDVPANTLHSARVGFMGCVCYEFPRLLDNPTKEV